MFAARKQYILQVNHTDADNIDDVGYYGQFLHRLHKIGINMPETIILSTQAFDDFITSGSLVDKIGVELEKINVDEEGSYVIASQNIENLLQQASFPSLILNPLVSAYQNISGLTDKYVAIKPSWIIEDDLVPEKLLHKSFLNIKGDANVAYHIKRAWGLLFSNESLLHRAQKGYEGGLSMAVIMQKMVQSEVSGVAYSIDPITEDKSTLEVQAVLGLFVDDNNLVPDVYKLERRDLHISEKTIMDQVEMVLRKGRAAPDEEPLIRVPISPAWRKQQKLSDKLIKKVGEITTHITDKLGFPVEVRWTVLGDVVYVVSVRRMAKFAMPDPFQNGHLNPHIEVVSAQMLDAASEAAPATTPMPDIASLAAEVMDIAEDMETNPEMADTVPEHHDAVADQEVKAAAETEPSEVADISEADTNEAFADLPAAQIPPNWDKVKDMTFTTRVLANATQMDNDSLYTVKKLHGGFMQMPDWRNTDKEYIPNAAMSLATLQKAAEAKRMAVQFTPIEENGVSGGEYYLLHPEHMLPQVQALRYARQEFTVTPGVLILPPTRHYDEISDLKKILSSQHLQRSAALKLYADVSIPSFAFTADDLDVDDVDGIFVDLSKLATALVGRAPSLDRDWELAWNAVQSLYKTVKHGKFDLLVALPASKADTLEFAGHLPLTGVILTDAPTQAALDSIAEHDSHQLTPTTAKAPAKRGRKPKALKK